MKTGHPSFLKKALYGLGALFIAAAISMVMISCGFPNNNYPSWSPDGSKIAFSHNSEIWVVNADGTNPTKISDNSKCPSWSPEGTQIAFVSKEGDIKVMSPDGSNQSKLVVSAGPPLILSWSPDGMKIAFSYTKIWVMNADGTDQKRLSSRDGDFWPAWSPNGTKIAFYSVSGRKADIWVMNADGSDQKSLTNGHQDYCPAWSPDGRITFVGKGGIWIMNADGSNLKILIPVGAESLAWSPDGSRIAYVSQVGEGTDIWVMDADGTNQMKLMK